MSAAPVERVACSDSRTLRESQRNGSALLLAVLILLLVDCLVIGTIQLARLERRLAATAVDALRLRLAAEGALASVLARWPATADSLMPGAPPLIPELADVEAGLQAEVVLEVLPGGVFMVRSRAYEPAPRTGVATTVRLVRPPVLPDAVDPAAAALSAVQLIESAGGIVAGTPADCDADPRPALRVTDPSEAAALAAVIEGDIVALEPDSALTRYLPRLAAAAGRPGVRVEEGDYVLDGSFAGMLVIEGSLVIAAAAEVRGLVIAAGDITVEVGARVMGAAHTAGHARVDGLVQLDACAVEQAVQAARLRLPRLLPHRPAVAGY